VKWNDAYDTPKDTKPRSQKQGSCSMRSAVRCAVFA
jgi:hypothetical protein